MLESVFDYFSLISLVIAIVIAIFYFVIFSNMHRMNALKKREEIYYSFYQNAYEDESDPDDTLL